MLRVLETASPIEIELALTDREHAVLASFVKQEGWDIIQKVMEDQVRQFNLKLINTGVDNPTEVLARHALAKGVTQFYAGLMNRLIHDLNVEMFNNRKSNIDDPQQATQIEELL